jgi:hypothetical protein
MLAKPKRTRNHSIALTLILSHPGEGTDGREVRMVKEDGASYLRCRTFGKQRPEAVAQATPFDL